MARVTKDAGERKKDILKAASKMFKKKGYEKTAVSDIVKEADIAQGTFYIYYRSKEDVFLAVLEKAKEEIIEELIKVQKRNDLNAIQKLNLIVRMEFDLNRNQDELFDELHAEKNIGIHQRFIVNVINKLTPIYASVIDEGIKEGLFHVKYPTETAEYILIAVKFMFDPGIFYADIDMESLKRKIEAVDEITEKILGVDDSSIDKGGLKLSDVIAYYERRK